MSAENRYDLTQGVIWKKLLMFFFPVLLGNLFQQLYNTVDTVIVGRLVSTTALAAVGGSAAHIINLVIGFFIGLASGGTVIIAQYFGAGDRDNLRRTLHTAITFCFAAGLALTVIGIVLAPWALKLVKTPADTMAESVAYLRIYFVGAIPQLIFNVGSGMLRAIGDSKRPLYYLIVCCFLNVALNLLFVSVLGMGVAGVAWGTVIAIFVSGSLILINLAGNPVCRLSFRELGIHWPSLKKLLRIGIPAGIQSMMYCLSHVIFQMSVNGFGTTAVAAWTTSSKMDGIYGYICNAFGISISAFVGQAIGAGKYDRMKKSIRVCLAMCVGMSAVMGAFLYFFCGYGFRMFTTDENVIAYAVEMYRWLAAFYVVWAYIDIISSAVRGAGEAVAPMLITCIGVCGVRVLWIVFAAPYWNSVSGVAMSYPVSWIITAIAYAVFYYRSGWQERCIKRVEAQVSAKTAAE